MEEFEKIKEAAKPLQEILENDYDPMHIVVISSQGIKIYGLLVGIPTLPVDEQIFDSTRGYFVPEHVTEPEK